jgi:hypothetical protein
MVRAGYRARVPDLRSFGTADIDSVEYPDTELSVRFHDLKLIGRQFPGLVEQFLADCDLADIVQRSGTKQQIHIPPMQYMAVNSLFRHAPYEQFKVFARSVKMSARDAVTECNHVRHYAKYYFYPDVHRISLSLLVSGRLPEISFSPGTVSRFTYIKMW